MGLFKKFKTRRLKIKELENENVRLREELKAENIRIRNNFNYNNSKIEDDFNVLNQILNLKLSHYKEIFFNYNRYKQDKKVNVTDEEIDNETKKIVYETFNSLSENYLNYLIDKYYQSKEKMIEIFTQVVYLQLFSHANEYNTTDTLKIAKNK